MSHQTAKQGLELSMKSIKCVLVGDAAVGKTSSLISYTTNRFPDGYLPTVFDNFSVKVTVDETFCTLGLFDTASQEDYDRLRLFSYPESDVIVVCFSVVKSSSLENVKTKWLPEIARYCPGVPFLLVGMQSDMRTDLASLHSLRRKGQIPVTTKQGRREARKLGAVMYLECSALTQEGLKKVFDNAIITALDPPKVSRFPSLSKTLKVIQRLLLRSRPCIR